MTREQLITALEKATGPDRALDAEIALLSHQDAEHISRPLQWTRDGREVKGKVFFEGWEDVAVYVDPFTSSIDAALTLVPEGWRAIADTSGNATLLPGDLPGEPVEHIHAASSALALCIAALKART